MNSESFIRASQAQVDRVVSYITNRAPGMIIGKTLRFIDGNFRAQGWQGQSFVPWKKNARNGTILVKSGALRRGINYTGAGPGAVRFYNNVKYAGIHNRGGTINKDVRVKAHKRRILSNEEVSAPGARKEKWVKMKTGTANVKSHIRKMNFTMPQRQFAPYEGSESPILNKSITRELEREVTNILNFNR